MKYIDLIAYPIMLAVVYVLIGFMNWDRDPQTWDISNRWLWVIWSLAWGWAMQRRIAGGGHA